jgi:broad specificity phosphatase PhoE
MSYYNCGTLKVLLIRHAESRNNIKQSADPSTYENTREPDPVLTENGISQA